MADFPIGTFTEEQCRLLWQDYQSRKQLIAPLQNNLPQRPIIDEPSPHRVFVKNNSGAEIPAFACMQITGATVEAGRVLITVRRPNTICGEYVFNSQFKIESGGYGWAYAWGIVRMLGAASGYESCKRYTAIKDSWSVTEGPGPFLVYGNGNIDGTVIGRIVGDHCQARWIKFEFLEGEENEEVTPTAFYDGQDPGACSVDGKVEVEYPLGTPLCDTPMMAFYDPNTGKYQAIDTPASILGEPVNATVVREITNDDCGINVGTGDYKMFPNSCNPSLNVSAVALGTETPVVVSISSDACGNISYAYQNIRAFICGNTVQFTDFDINFDGVEFVTAAAFGPPSCSGEAVYRIGLNVGLTNWELVTPCENGCESDPPPLPGSIPTPETFETVPCASKPDSQCGLNLQMGTICQDTSSGAPLPTIVHVRLPLEPVKVVTEVYDNAVDAIIIESKTIYVCNWEAYPDDQIDIGNCDTTSSGGSGA